MKVEDCPDAFYGESVSLFENKIRPADVGRSADEVMEAYRAKATILSFGILC